MAPETNVNLAAAATVERMRDAVRVHEQGGGPKRQLAGARQDATAQPQESEGQARAVRRPGSSIHLDMLGGLLDVVIQYEQLPAEQKLATLEAATRIVKADIEEPLELLALESHRGGCQGHA